MSASFGMLQPDARELIIANDARFVCDTYIFEPSAGEEKLGHLFAVGEIEDRDGVGRELLDMVVAAIQKEYYRDPQRAVQSCLELALHQANLILHDASEQGVRDWMGYFHVAIAILTGDKLHISTAGEATVLLVRKSRVVDISIGLSHSPVTNPLRTFSQVATGTLTPRDTVFLSTSAFPSLFRHEDLSRFAIDHSAATISTRLQQLYTDQKSTAPVASLIISILPQYVVEPHDEPLLPTSPRRAAAIREEYLRPRQPLVLERSWIKSIMLIIGRAGKQAWQLFRTYAWPHIQAGSRRGGRVLWQASRVTGRSVATLTSKQLERLRRDSPPGKLVPYQDTDQSASQHTSMLRFSPPRLSIQSIKSAPVHVWLTVRRWIAQMPRTSKLFAGITVLLVIALLISLVLLQRKRAEDQHIQRASEILHEARTKKDAAETALIYDNRDQAHSLLTDAARLTNEVRGTGFYIEETNALAAQITAQQDRLQRVVRVSTETVRILGDFSSVITQDPPISIFFVNDALYTFNPANNSLIKMTLDGTVTSATQTTQGIGFFTDGVVQQADKTIILLTDTPEIVIFDTKDDSVLKQDIQFASAQPQISSLAPFGNRLYVYDAAAKNIFSYNKTLRGYAGGEPWITDASFPADQIRSLGIDGNIYTLLANGTVHRLFKGGEAEFTQERVEPALSSATRLLASEELRYIYVLDRTNKRVVVFGKEGELIRQVLVDVAADMRDFAVNSAEDTLYVLDGTRVLAVSLAE